MMHRRNFNKGVGAFFGTLALPGGIKAVGSVSESAPVFVANKVEMTTTFDLSQAFTLGDLSIYENIEEEPYIDVDVSFWLDKDHKIERKVCFEGDDRTWSEFGGVVSYKENGVGSFKTFEPGTENRVPLNELRLDDFYDITITCDSKYIITLRNFQVTKITT